MIYPKTEGTIPLYQEARDALSLYIQVRYDELESEYDLDYEDLEKTIKDEINVLVDDALYS